MLLDLLSRRPVMKQLLGGGDGTGVEAMSERTRSPAPNLPPNPEVPTTYMKKSWTSAAIAAGTMLGAALLAFLGDNNR